jgi:hypothetical protein
MKKFQAILIQILQAILMLLFLLSIFLILSCSNEEEKQNITFKRLDVSYGKIGSSYDTYDYITGPIDSVLNLYETSNKNLRIIMHVENSVALESQHILLDGQVEEVHYFTPVLQPTEENQAWATGWEIHIVNGELAVGEFEICVWLTGIDGSTSDIECLDFEVKDGQGTLLPEDAELKVIL